MGLRLGDEAPNFEAETTEGHINFHDWLGDSWGVLFSHPKAFTPVCTTELGYMASIEPEFAKRNTKIIGLSVDPLESNEGWERVRVCDTWPGRAIAASVRWQGRVYRKLYDYTSRVDAALGAFNWRVKAGDSTQITDYQAGDDKLTRELAEAELGWSASAPVQPAQLAAWFGRPELARLTPRREAGRPGSYRNWAKVAIIFMTFMNFERLLSGGFLPFLIGLALLWFPAAIADKLGGGQ